MKRFGKNRGEGCECEYNFTCRVCCNNAPPYLYTPTKTTDKEKEKIAMDNLAHKPALPYAIVDDVEWYRDEGNVPVRALVKYVQCVHAIGKPWIPERIAIIERECEEAFILQACNALTLGHASKSHRHTT